MSENIFFKRKGPFKIQELFKGQDSKSLKITDIKTLDNANKSEISFFDSIKYKDIASTTKAGFCITTDKLKMYLPTACIKIVVKSVLFEFILILLLSVVIFSLVLVLLASFVKNKVFNCKLS